MRKKFEKIICDYCDKSIGGENKSVYIESGECGITIYNSTESVDIWCDHDFCDMNCFILFLKESLSGKENE